MIIDNLDTMEKIVKNNKALSWDGWSVVARHRSEKGANAVNGIFIGGEWYVQNVYHPDRNGWSIPDRFVKTNGQA